MSRAWIAVPFLLALAGCSANIDAGSGSHVSTVVDHTSDAGGVKTHLRLVMDHYAVRAALGTNPNTAAYITIRNEGNVSDRLVSASCACAGETHLHTMVMQGADMVMDEPKDGFPLAPGQSVVFAPGGNHIMLAGLKTPPKAGGLEIITLTFEKAGAVPVGMPVSDTPLAKSGG